MKYLIFLLLIGLSYNVAAQRCQTYNCAIQKVKININKKDYTKAFKALESAAAYPESNKDEVNQLQNQIFAGITQLQKDTKAALKTAREERRKAENAKNETEKVLIEIKAEKQRTQIALEKIEAEKAKADSLNAKNQKLIDAFYFYDGKFALSAIKDNEFGKETYGFVNKDGKAVINYKYDKAELFDYTGFAKVSKGEDHYLIDTTGKEYIVAYELKNLDSNTIALDLRGTQLDSFPLEILNHTQLQILILDGKKYQRNRFIELPTDINKLSQLEHLYLRDCNLEKLPTTFDFVNLKALNLGENRISKIDCLKKLTNLVSLDLGANKIQEINSLKNLTDLTSLYLGYNQISEINSLEKLTNLMKLNIVSNTNINDITVLKNLTSLTILEIGRNQISEISSLKNLTNLTVLDLGSNQISEISSLKNLTNLTVLDLGRNQIQEISSLKNLTNLTSLDLGYNPIIRIELSDLTKLSTFRINRGNVNSIETIKLNKLASLQYFQLYGVTIQNVIIEDLPKLTTLNLSRSNIQNIRLNNLPELTELKLTGNQLSETNQNELRKSLPNCKITF